MTNSDIVLLNNLLKIGKYLGSVPFTLENNNKFKVTKKVKCTTIFVQILLICVTIISIIKRVMYINHINTNTYIFLDILEIISENVFFANCFIYSTLYNTKNWKGFINKINEMEKQFNYKSYSLTKTYTLFGFMIIFLTIMYIYEQICYFYIAKTRDIHILIIHGIYLLLLIYEFHSIFLIIHTIKLINHRYNHLYAYFVKEFSTPKCEARLITSLCYIQDQFTIISDLSKIVNKVFGWHIVCFICSAVCVTIFCIYLAIFEHHSIDFLIFYAGFCSGYTVRK